MDIRFIDKVHLQKYVYIILSFTSQRISVSEFQELFLKIRREDKYWLSGSFDKRIGKILDSFFLDVSDYSPNNLFDPNDVNDINESELKKRADNVLFRLREFL